MDTIDNCKVVFDVTQISYQPSDRVYQASRALQRKFSPYRAQKVKTAIYSVYLVEKVNKGNFSVYRATKVNEGKFSLYRARKVNEEDQCLPSSLGVQRILHSFVVFTEPHLVNTENCSNAVFTEKGWLTKDF